MFHLRIFSYVKWGEKKPSLLPSSTHIKLFYLIILHCLFSTSV
jgi:hypothetical protein